MGTIDKNSGQISLDDTHKDTIDIQIVFTSNIPTVLIKEKATGKVLFSVILQGKTALNTTVTNSARSQKKLNDGY